MAVPEPNRWACALFKLKRENYPVDTKEARNARGEEKWKKNAYRENAI
jgi:hypothetical protein